MKQLQTLLVLPSHELVAVKNATWKSLLVNMSESSEQWTCKKYISHVCKRDEPSGQLRIYYSGTMPKQKDNLRGD